VKDNNLKLYQSSGSPNSRRVRIFLAYSIADITALVTVDFASKAINVPLPDEHAALRRWYELVSKRPSASA